MPAVFIKFPKTVMTFYLFDDEVDDKMKKKLSKLGLADLGVEFPQDPNQTYEKGVDGLYRAGEVSTDGFPITGSTEESIFNTSFNPEDNSVIVSLEGRFFCFNTIEDIEPVSEWKSGYVWGTRLKNDKGKLIKKPKDEWGMTNPIEALAEKGIYGGGAHHVLFSIDVDEETFYG